MEISAQPFDSSIVILSTPPSVLSFNKINSNIPVLTLPTLSLNVLPNKGARAGTCQNLQHDLNIWYILNILDFHKHICFNRQRQMCYVLNLKWLGDLSIYKPGIRIRSTQEKADSVSEISFACCQRKSGFIWVDKIWEEVVVWWVLSWSRRIHLAELRCGLADASQDALWALDYISAKRFLLVWRGRRRCGSAAPPGGARCQMFSLHTRSSWANVWNPFWMASTGPVGKSHTVTFYCTDRNGRLNWERQTGKTPSQRNIYSLESRVIHSWLRRGCRKQDIYKDHSHKKC